MRHGFVGIGLLALWLVFAVPGSAAPQGGLATLVGRGGAVASATISYAERDVVAGGRDDQVSSVRTVVRGEYGLWEGLDVYALFGVSDLVFDQGDFEGSRGGLLGAGLRYGLLSRNPSGLRLILDLQGEYSRVADGPRSVRQQVYHAATYVVKEIGPAGRVGYFYPFAGVQVSYARLNGKGGLEDFRGEDYVGMFAGADYFVSPNVYFSGEIHLFDETSLAVGAGYRF